MRFIFLISLISSYLLALINAPIHTPVTGVDKESEKLTIKTLSNTQVGMYGVVSHWFDKSHSIALSWVEIKKIDGDITTLKLTPILALEQSALPNGTWEPKIGDDVVIGYNYQRALLIAPTPSIYRKITSYHRDRTWIHPDVFASHLSYNGHPSPLKEDFTSMCRQNNIGTIAFMFDKSIITVDCQTFKILKNKSTSVQSKESQVPFYSRVPNIEANWFGDGSNEIEDYDRYYINLLVEYNPKNEWIKKYKHNREAALGSDESNWFSSLFDGLNVSIGFDDHEDD